MGIIAVYFQFYVNSNIEKQPYRITYKEKTMADKSKLEQMLEKLVNDDRNGAEELFHEFVIEKSRDIYEGLLENDLEDLEVTEKEEKEEDEDKEEETKESSENDEEAVDEATEEDEETTENFDEIPLEADDDMGGDPADDMIADIEAPGDDEDGDKDSGDDEEIEDRVVDLEDALDDLKAEFEQMMADKGGDEDEGEGDDAEMDMDADEEGDEEKEEAIEPVSDLSVAEESDEEVEEGDKSEAETMREYVEKITMPTGEDNKATSPVASKNDMGGTASNIAQGEDAKGGKESGLSSNSPKEENAGNVNVPGGKASKSMSNAKGHGAEKKGSGEEGGVNSKSIHGA